MNNLAKKRKELGLTQEHVAKLAGVSRRTYQTYEENEIDNETYRILDALVEEISSGRNRIIPLTAIKTVVRRVLKNYPEVAAAYLFGSYARGEATGKSDIDILLVLNEPMGMKYFEIGAEIKEALNKEVDLLTHKQLMNDEYLLKRVLTDAIKIY